MSINKLYIYNLFNCFFRENLFIDNIFNVDFDIYIIDLGMHNGYFKSVIL